MATNLLITAMRADDMDRLRRIVASMDYATWTRQSACMMMFAIMNNLDRSVALLRGMGADWPTGIHYSIDEWTCRVRLVSALVARR